MVCRGTGSGITKHQVEPMALETLIWELMILEPMALETLIWEPMILELMILEL